MTIDPRCFILFGCNALLLFLAQLVNSSLATVALHLVLIGPMVALPPLYLRHRSSFACLLLTGLWVDATLPVPYGLFTTCLPTIGTFLSIFHHRFRAEHNGLPIWIAHGANLAVILLLSLYMSPDFLFVPGYWLHIGTTLLLSHLVLLIVAPWFFNFERMFFSLLRVNTEPEDSLLR